MPCPLRRGSPLRPFGPAPLDKGRPLGCGFSKALWKSGTSASPSAYAGAEGGIDMCVKTEQLGLVLLGAGIGLLVSFALCGWFLRVLVAIILIVLGLLLLK